MNPQNRSVNIEQLQNSLKLLYAKVELWEQKIKTFKYRAQKERELTEAIAKATIGRGYVGPGFQSIDSADAMRTISAYLTAHKNNTEAEEQLMQITVAELKSQVAITEAVISQTESPIADPGKLRLS